MNPRTSRISLVAVLAPVALFVGSCTTDTTASTRTTQPATSATSSTSATTPSSGPPLLSDVPQGDLKPGRYTVAAVGRPDLPRAILEIPAGFESGGWYMASKAGFLSYWGITGIYKDPCTREGGTVPVQGSADAVARQLVSGLDVKASAPTPIRIGGHDGLYLELTAPDIDYNACTDGFTYWDSGGGDRYVQSAGTVDRVWVLDVDRKVVILNTSTGPDDSKRAVQVATSVVEKATFTRPDGSPLP